MKPAFRLTPVIAALGVAAGLTFRSASPDDQDRRSAPPARSPSTATWSAKALTRRSKGINAAGGVNGKKAGNRRHRRRREPKQGPVAANRVVNSKIGFVVGHVRSGATIAAADVTTTKAWSW